MDRRVALTLVVAVFLPLAGCSALPVWDDPGGTPTPDSGTATPTVTPTPAESVPGANPGGEGGDGPEDASYPPGYNASGVSDAGTATAAHVDALLNYPNYLFTYQSRLETAQGNTSFTYNTIVDNEGEVAYVVRDTSQGAQAFYYEDDRVYVRDETGDDTRYNSSDRQYNMEEFSGVQFIGPLLGSVEYNDAEVFETDNGTYYRYTSAEVTDPQAILGTEVDEDRLDRFDVSIVVDSEGAVRAAMFVVEADNDVTARMSVGEVGSTTVERPTWFDEADDS
ncbi:hypothetical protein HWV23_16900 [Natronomonas halophila]|uniref:hypothetical protein n=1 Tax=Natronomonas halophila TaxID=2747817 RepID=UPI0015B3AAAC|nr:hypothetical protein [Natronomonas halophila]QLD87330.1 hypothetical protein HWV23_16900 [Natronomonas halophila]